VIRASMVIIYFFFGYQKWFPYEAHTLIPFISRHDPCCVIHLSVSESGAPKTPLTCFRAPVPRARGPKF
jgi:hypothetical protein